tara:strand:- start:260 stop:424 length:165 start_codon:yes stop_codon:yes gene_type:complete
MITFRDYFMRALEWAHKDGLAWEFKWSYKKARREGHNIPTAVDIALDEWDMWPT